MNPKIPNNGSLDIRERDGSLIIRVRVHPKASSNSIAGTHAGALKIRVTPAPEDGKANRAVIELISEALRIGKSAVTILRGETSRDKLVKIRGVAKESVVRLVLT